MMKAALSAMLMLSLQSFPLVASTIASTTAPATTQSGPPAQRPNAQQKPETNDSGEEPDAAVVTAPPVPKKSVQENVNLAWQLLQEAIGTGNVQTRIDAVNAVGTMSASPQAVAIVARTIKDSERDVRVATVVAMGDMRAKATLPLLHQALSDASPNVSFAAAATLWKRGDYSGEQILSEVLIGRRKAAPGLIGQGLHTADRDLHSPSTLATLGAEQGAYALLGPFGIGLDAYKVLHGRGANGNSARVVAANLLAKDAKPALVSDFLIALKDKDYFVRIAAAHALGAYHGRDVNDALLDAFLDPKPAVRYVAAASYIRSNEKTAKTTPAAK